VGGKSTTSVPSSTRWQEAGKKRGRSLGETGFLLALNEKRLPLLSEELWVYLQIANTLSGATLWKTCSLCIL